MHARITHFEASDMPAIEAQLENLAAKTSEIPGLISSTALWNDDGSGALVVVYETAEQAAAGQAIGLAIWNGIMGHLKGMPSATEYAKVHKMK